jgi:hypothetical protein
VIDWRRIRTRLLAAVAVVAGLGLAIELWHARSHTELVELLLPKLSLSYEANLPTWFSSSLLLACAVAAGSIAAARPPMHRHWWCIAVLATYLSLDEAAEIHEHLGGHLDTTGWLYFDWVVPASVIVIALVVLFLPFIRALHPRTRLRLIIAGIIYVGGALIMELPLGRWTDAHGSEGLGYALIDWIEETMEMVGATLAFVALLAHRELMRDADR